MIGLPDHIRAVLFDLDGVLTGTAALHREAWRATFDEFLRHRDAEHFVPFSDQDYARYVDGRPRATIDVTNGTSTVDIANPGAGHDVAVRGFKSDVLRAVVHLAV